MSIKIYVGNLSFDSSDPLKELFETYGEVDTAKIIFDQFAGRSRGFGFIEMQNREEGLKAIQELDSKELGGLSLKVNEARPRIERATVHVIPRAKEWAVKREGDESALRVLSTKEEAVKFATELLESRGFTEVVVHEKDGSVAARRYSGPRKRRRRISDGSRW